MNTSSGILDALGMAALSNHWTTLLGSTVACTFIMQLSQVFSPRFFPKTYPKLSTTRKMNWDVHVVSTVHSILVVLLAAPALQNETLLKDKVFGYEYSCAQVFAVACGYFLWDTFFSILHIKEFGVGFVFHGICSFTVYIFSFRPFLQYYGNVFLMYEMSTPFLNAHWFMDKMGMTGSLLQLINGIILLTVFFFARIVFGFYMSYDTYLNVLPVSAQVPLHLMVIYSVANVVLNTLNIYWFFKMIESLVKRFQPSKGKDSQGKKRVSGAQNGAIKAANKGSLAN
ncbi:hypothetical protein BGZ99_006642 [Dissophora globulifera]|uniref:TLC domain-containing protein n=1 Tax=Dissophora globulifera TaxID=979702 RepID=A0A9P6US45_9FUNG|nr:hypothetical protein BGZ99_006642 [Dissophora globulifera]